MSSNHPLWTELAQGARRPCETLFHGQPCEVTSASKIHPGLKGDFCNLGGIFGPGMFAMYAERIHIHAFLHLLSTWAHGLRIDKATYSKIYYISHCHKRRGEDWWYL